MSNNDILQLSFDQWHFNNEIDLIIADPPFGINFSGKPSNYNRKNNLVVDGYIEWKRLQIPYYLEQLFISAEKYLKQTGCILLFAGWQLSNLISQIYRNIEDTLLLSLQGKLYWNFNFAPACKKRPNHNVYEIFWFTKHPTKYTYNKYCSHSHCQKGEANLTAINIKKEYIKGIPKYPTRLPSELIATLIEHFSNPYNKILDFMCGSGITGIVCELLYPDREIFLGDLNPNSQIVYSALFNHFKKNWKLSDNLSAFLPSQEK